MKKLLCKIFFGGETFKRLFFLWAVFVGLGVFGIAKIPAASAATNVYYSVGQSPNNFCGPNGNGTSCGNVSIASGVATFSAAQAGNIGVGDVVTYGETNQAYISEKISVTQWRLVTATGGTPANVTNQAVNSIARTFTALVNAFSGTGGILGTVDLVSGDYIVNLPCYYDTGADETYQPLEDWTTGPDNYVKIYTPQGGNESNFNQRHSGKWADNKYRVEVFSPYEGLMNISIPYVWIDGLQVFNTAPDDYNAWGIYFYHKYEEEGSPDDWFKVSNSIIRGSGTHGEDGAGGIYTQRSSGTLYTWNNIIYDFSGGGDGTYFAIGAHSDSSVLIYAYNNTAYNCEYGLGHYGSGAFVAKNNLIANTTDAYYGTFASGTDYNATDINDTPGQGSNNRVNQTFSFENVADKNFHLAKSDTGAKDFGANLSNDANLPFSTDIDGHPRKAPWDIGADEEGMRFIYYSVGQDNTTDRKTGSPTITISDGIGTFRDGGGNLLPQIGNIGVGDRVTYNTTSHAYISQKISQSQWRLVTAQGDTPPNVSGQAVNSIKRVFSSLSAAESGAAGLLGTADLATGGYVLNFPCYYDTGADTTAVVIDGWTTTDSNYIKIYTPQGGNESNQSQRHNGKWEADKYRIFVSGAWDNNFTINSVNHVRIEGLILDNGVPQGEGGRAVEITSGGAEIHLSHNIIRRSAGGGWPLLDLNAAADNVVIKVWNNIIYDLTDHAAISFIDRWSGGSLYVYNNTIYNCKFGIVATGTGYVALAKNNIYQSNNISDADGYDGTTTGSDYNLSNLSGDAPGPNSRNSTSVSFVNASARDLHLASSDTGARNYGDNLSSDQNLAFSDDIDGQTRTGAWDIGADETAAIHIYRSVGPGNISPLASSSGQTLNISEDTAVFSINLPANIGVGDVIVYNSFGSSNLNSVAFIHGRTSASKYTVKNAAGKIPNGASTTNWQIYRAYTQLHNAAGGGGWYETPQDSDGGEENTGIPAHLRNFDTWIGGKNLSSSGEIWNVACYADAPDTTFVNLRSLFGDEWEEPGWITTPDNYIRIFTPHLPSEVGTSQRHNGKWDEAKYHLTNSLYISGHLHSSPDIYAARHVRIEGLQISKNESEGDGISAGFLGSSSDIRISHNIIKGPNSSSAAKIIGIYLGTSPANGPVFSRIWNNIIYDFMSSNSGSAGIHQHGGGHAPSYVYNNTIINAYKGIHPNPDSWNMTLKNNIVQDCVDGLVDEYNLGYEPPGSGYNLSDLSNDFYAPTSKNNTTVNFVNKANKDFHLASNDTGARNSGANLSFDSGLRFTDDIDGAARGVIWDIGADEQAVSETEISTTHEDDITGGLALYQSFDGPHMDWRFSSNQARDQSGQEKHGTATNMDSANAAIGKLGQALRYNGSNNYVTVGSLDQNVNSVSFWVKPSTTTQYVLDLDGGTRYVWINSGTVTATGFSSPVIYVDGAQTTTFPNTDWHQITVTTSASFAASNVVIGRVSSNYFSGLIDEVRVYNRALSASEIISLYRLGEQKINMSLVDKNRSGLVGLWSFDGADISGTTAYDRSGNGNNGAITGATPFLGKRGQALRFTVNGQYVNVGSASSLDDIETQGGGGMAASAWIYPLSLGQDNCGTIACKDNLESASGTWCLRLDTGAAVDFRKDYSTTDLLRRSSNGVVALNRWSHLTLTWDGSANFTGVRIYIDAVETTYLTGENAEGTKNSDAANDLILGNSAWAGRTFHGLIDEVRIYNRVLTAQEIRNLYNLGEAKFK